MTFVDIFRQISNIWCVKFIIAEKSYFSRSRNFAAFFVERFDFLESVVRVFTVDFENVVVGDADALGAVGIDLLLVQEVLYFD